MKYQRYVTWWRQNAEVFRLCPLNVILPDHKCAVIFDLRTHQNTGFGGLSNENDDSDG